jgi:hypothetical protein
VLVDDGRTTNDKLICTLCVRTQSIVLRLVDWTSCDYRVHSVYLLLKSCLETHGLRLSNASAYRAAGGSAGSGTAKRGSAGIDGAKGRKGLLAPGAAALGAF